MGQASELLSDFFSGGDASEESIYHVILKSFTKNYEKQFIDLRSVRKASLA